MTNEMVMFSNGEITFLYRVGGLAVHDGRLLVEHNVRHGFCFVPGGRVEYGENAVQALTRELDEEFGGDVRIGRLVVVADNLFELNGRRYQEVGMYFLMKFTRDTTSSNVRGISRRRNPISFTNGYP